MKKNYLLLVALSFLTSCETEDVLPANKTNGCGKISSHPCSINEQTRIPYQISETRDVSISYRKITQSDGSSVQYTGVELCNGQSTQVKVSAKIYGVHDYYKFSCTNSQGYPIQKLPGDNWLCDDEDNCTVTQCRETTESWQDIDVNCNKHLQGFEFWGLKKNTDGSYTEVAKLVSAQKSNCVLNVSTLEMANYDGIRLKASVQWSGTGAPATNFKDVLCR